jgi:NAD(P)-dependent dehydrogenase (short-subunit alcohol dehydrogenase family)
MVASGELQGKVALVTGATRGLGRAIAFAMSCEGATVVVSSRKPEACQETAEAITAETGNRTIPLPLHMGNWDDMEPAVEKIIDEAGQLDVVVNNAGIAPLAPSLLEADRGIFDKTMEVNLAGPFRLMAVAGAHMAEKGSGSIINISSIGAVRPSPAEAMYAAAKAGLNALTMAFAQEYAPHVRVNAVLPGSFATEMASNWDDEFIGLVTNRLPAGRLGEPDEITGMVVHLAGDRAGYTTGSIIHIDGGRTAVY